MSKVNSRISDGKQRKIERILNCSIHELVFANQHCDQDDVEDAENCLVTVQGNIEQVMELLKSSKK